MSDSLRWPGRAFLAGLALLLVGAGAASASEVPVRSVALFTSGVGFFQHRGEILGGRTIQLSFKSDQIDDLLKSLVLEDLNGGQPGFVVYPSRDPLERTLRGFQLDLSGDPSMAGLLGQLRGAAVTVHVAGEAASARLIGVERRPLAIGDDGEAIEDWVVNLMTDQGLRSLFLRDIQSLEMADPGLNAELRKALNALNEGRGEGRKLVTLRFPGDGVRQVRIGYVVETPVWKTSYRLILAGGAEGEAGPAGEGPQPHLQGWAIVENQTDNDWDGVRLSLVSGRPISFIQNLYEPLYAQRPRLRTQARSGPGPRVYQSGIPAAEGRMRRSAPGWAMAQAAPAPMAEMMADAVMGYGAGETMDDAEAPMDPTRIAAAAAGSEQGALFQYTVENVSLPRRRSAMIPIVAGPISARQVSIYNQSVLANHPLSGVYLENDSGMHLPAGPVTLFEGGGYAGDARLDELPAGETRLLSYAVDLAVKVLRPHEESESHLTTGRVAQGVLVLTRKRLRTTRYTAENTDDAPRLLVVEHPLQPGWSLTDQTPEPRESTAELHRFEQPLAAGETVSLTIGEERIDQQGIALLSGAASGLAVHANNQAIPAPVRRALARAMELKQAVEAIQVEIRDNERRIQDETREQERIRRNLAATRAGQRLHDRMMAKLDRSESAIEQLRDANESLREKLGQAQNRLEGYLRGLDVG